MKKKIAKKKSTKAKKSPNHHFAVSFIAIISVFLIAVAFVFGAYYGANPESHVLAVTSDLSGSHLKTMPPVIFKSSSKPTATPTPTKGGQVAVNFVKYDTVKKGWVYVAVSNPTELNLIDSKGKTLEVAHVVKNSQGYSFKRRPLGNYSVRFNPSLAVSAAICTSDCFSIPTSGYSKTNPVKVTVSTNNQMLNIYLQVKK